MMLHPAAPVGGNWNFELAGEAMIFVHGSTLFEAAGGAPATSFAEGGEVVAAASADNFSVLSRSS